MPSRENCDAVRLRPLQHIVHMSPISSGIFHSGKVCTTVPRVVAEGIVLGVPFTRAAPWRMNSFTVVSSVHKADPNQVNSLGLPVRQVRFNICVRSELGDEFVSRIPRYKHRLVGKRVHQVSSVRLNAMNWPLLTELSACPAAVPAPDRARVSKLTRTRIETYLFIRDHCMASTEGSNSPQVHPFSPMQAQDSRASRREFACETYYRFPVAIDQSV